MRFYHAFSFAAATAFLVACDSTVTNVNDDAKNTGTITIKAVDNHSGAALSGVTVYSVVDDETVVSDELGLSVWSDQLLGDHSYQVSKDGYATVHAFVTLQEQGMGDVPRVGDVIATVPMYKAGVQAKGIVLYHDDKGKLKAASGVTVYAKLPDIFVPSELTEKTTESGEYSFNNLPEGTEVSIYVGQEQIDSKKYVGGEAILIGGETFRAGDVVNVASINLSKSTQQVVRVADNTTEIDTTSDVTFTYATELERDSVTTANWSVETSAGRNVLISVSLSSDKRTVSVSPYSGKWTKGSSYTVTGTVYSVDGASSKVSTSFVVGQHASSEKPDNVKGLKIEPDEFYDDEVVLSWNESKEDVYRYNIYRKTNVANDFSYVTYTTDTTYTIDLDDFSSSVTTLYYIVLPVNDEGVEADIEDAEFVKYTIEK
jgi:hypothetical protein